MLGKIMIYDPEEDRRPEAKPSPDKHIRYEEWRPKHEPLRFVPGWMMALTKINDTLWSRYGN